MKINQVEISKKSRICQSQLSAFFSGKKRLSAEASVRLERACIEMGIPGFNRFDALYPSESKSHLFRKYGVKSKKVKSNETDSKVG